MINSMQFLYLVASYLIGNILTAYIVTKLRHNVDIRDEGSGNPGARNMGRVYGKRYFIATFLGDAIKGAIVVAVAKSLYETDLYETGLSFLHVVVSLPQKFYNLIYVYFQIPNLDQQLYKLTPCLISFIYLIKNDKWRLSPLIKHSFYSRFTYRISTIIIPLNIVVTIE